MYEMKEDAIKIFITGASGTIGRAILEDIGERSLSLREIVALMRNKSLIDLPGIKIVRGDICGLSEDIIRELEDTDVFVHLAALVHRPETSPELYEEVNDRATKKLVDTFRQVSRSKIKQFIFISTVLVFGNYKSEIYLEEDETNPDTPYGISKLEAEKYIKKSEESDPSFKYTVLRLTPVYGKGDKGNVGKMIRFIKRFRFFPIFGKNIKKCPVYAGDVSLSIISCINNEKALGKTFTISGPAISVEDMATDIGHQFGVDVRLPQIPAFFLNSIPTVKKLTRTDIYSNKKAMEDIHYKPRFFKEGLEAMMKKGEL